MSAVTDPKSVVGLAGPQSSPEHNMSKSGSIEKLLFRVLWLSGCNFTFSTHSFCGAGKHEFPRGVILCPRGKKTEAKVVSRMASRAKGFTSYHV